MAKRGNIIKPRLIKIITIGPLEVFVVDWRKLNNKLAIILGYTWVVDIIDHFTKYIGLIQ